MSLRAKTASLKFPYNNTPIPTGEKEAARFPERDELASLPQGSGSPWHVCMAMPTLRPPPRNLTLTSIRVCGRSNKQSACGPEWLRRRPHSLWLTWNCSKGLSPERQHHIARTYGDSLTLVQHQ